MSLILMLALQAAAAPPAIAEVDFDLARYGQAAGQSACRRDDPSAIVVCARRGNGTYPLEHMARIFEPHHIVAETRLSRNMVADVHGEEVVLDRGAVSKRAMVRLSIGF